MGQGQQSNESAIEQAKDEQISDFIRGQYKTATGRDFFVKDKVSAPRTPALLSIFRNSMLLSRFTIRRVVEQAKRRSIMYNLPSINHTSAALYHQSFCVRCRVKVGDVCYHCNGSRDAARRSATWFFDLPPTMTVSQQCSPFPHGHLTSASASYLPSSLD